MAVIKKKICLLGSFGVGKTSLIRRFVLDSFEEAYLSTIGVNISQKKVRSANETEYDFLIWDIEGHEKFTPAVQNYYTGAAGAILTADLTRPDSLQHLSTILSRFQMVNPGAKLVFCATKSDLISASDTIVKEYISWAEDNQLPCFVTSAKENSNVEKSFTALAGLL